MKPLALRLSHLNAAWSTKRTSGLITGALKHDQADKNQYQQTHPNNFHAIRIQRY